MGWNKRGPRATVTERKKDRLRPWSEEAGGVQARRPTPTAAMQRRHTLVLSYSPPVPLTLTSLNMVVLRSLQRAGRPNVAWRGKKAAAA